MKKNTILTILLAATGAILLTRRRSNTVYFAGTEENGIYHVPAKGGTPERLVKDWAMVRGVACSKDGQLLYVTQQTTITRLGTDGSNQGVVIQTGSADCVALDDKAGRLYWGDRGQNHVASCNVQGGDLRVLIEGVNYPNAVAVNPKLGWLYWVEHAPERGVWMAQMDGTDKHPISLEGATPRGLAVDRKSGRIFWSRPELHPNPAQIITANFDGSDPKNVVSLKNRSIEGLAVDEKTRRIIWIERTGNDQTDIAPALIRSAKFDGSALKTIYEFPEGQHALSVAVGPPQHCR